MALQDLTPQLRTRLSRMERAVGWFVILALLLLGFGFAYYIYNTAERKGWFKTKAPYFTFTVNATGLRVGDPVKLMGFDVGQITEITAMPAEQFDYNVYIQFELKEPFFEYMWTKGSQARVASADLLGKRVLEVSKGTGGYPTYILYPLRTNVSLAEVRDLPDRQHWLLAQEIYDASGTNVLAEVKTPLTNLDFIAAAGVHHIWIMNTNRKARAITGIWNDHEARYDPFTKRTKYWLESEESPAITERLENLIQEVEQAMPSVLSLTNQLITVLSNSASLTSNLNAVAAAAQPAVSNLAAATARLDQPGALGEWLLPTNLNYQLESTLTNANVALTSANTNLSVLVQNLNESLLNLANMTSNLNQQVQANTNLVSAVSQTIIHADEFVQGLKRHWLLRSAFRTKDTNAPPRLTRPPLRSPKDRGR
ncbi:MAG TPA: MlaD family protein [Clostridia bacterium]|nr:MlaD family protein [Clostridia bacterium]